MAENTENSTIIETLSTSALAETMAHVTTVGQIELYRKRGRRRGLMKISVDYEKLIEVLGNVSCLNCPMAEKCNKEANNIPMVMKADDPSVCAKYILDNWLLEGNPLEWTRIMREAVPSITAANQSTLPEGYHPYPQEIPTETYKRYKVVLKNGDEVETTFKRTNFTRKEVVGWKW